MEQEVKATSSFWAFLPVAIAVFVSVIAIIGLVLNWLSGRKKKKQKILEITELNLEEHRKE